MRDLISTGIVLRSIVAVFSGAVLTLGGVGVITALGNGRIGIAIVLALLTLVVALGSILAARSFLQKYDAEAYEFRRYD